MRKLETTLASIVMLASGAAAAQSPTFGVGHAPTEEETRILSPFVMPDGKGLPKGSGTALQGKQIFGTRCATCHGIAAEGVTGPALVGGKGSLATAKPLRTIGSYWPYATTIWDYIYRAMPFNNPGTLTHDEVYALSAYLLYINGLVGEKQVLNAKNLPRIVMPNRNGFVPDPRPDVTR